MSTTEKTMKANSNQLPPELEALLAKIKSNLGCKQVLATLTGAGLDRTALLEALDRYVSRAGEKELRDRRSAVLKDRKYRHQEEVVAKGALAQAAEIEVLKALDPGAFHECYPALESLAHELRMVPMRLELAKRMEQPPTEFYLARGTPQRLRIRHLVYLINLVHSATEDPHCRELATLIDAFEPKPKRNMFAFADAIRSRSKRLKQNNISEFVELASRANIEAGKWNSRVRSGLTVDFRSRKIPLVLRGRKGDEAWLRSNPGSPVQS